MMNRGMALVSGLFLGALVGAGLVLLFAPGSGAETQQAIRDYVQGVLDEGQQAAEERRLELTARLEELKQPNPQSA